MSDREQQRFCELGERWDKWPGDAIATHAFVRACIWTAAKLGMPFPVFREAIACQRRAGLPWPEALRVVAS